MVRTRADAVSTRVAGAKAPRKNFGGASNTQISNANIDKSKGREHSGGNSYCPRETPEWQKPITSFFNRPPESRESSKRREQMEFLEGDLAAGTSTSSGVSTPNKETTD